MKVALIIVNFNGGSLLDRCLAAVHHQSRPPDRIMVVDNASSDGSAECVATRWQDVELLSLKKNIGFAAANNRAIARCTDCEWLALLNPDAFPESNWLEALVHAALKYPEAGSFASCLVSADDANILDGAGDIYHVSGLVWRHGHGRPRHSLSMTGLQQVFAACAAAALYRRDAVVEAGGFDEDYFCYNEDVDLAFRLRLLGLDCWFVPDAVATHIGSAVTGKHSDFSLYHGHRNLEWTYIKNMPASLIRRHWWQHALMFFISVTVLSLKYRSTAVLRGKISAVYGIRRVLRQRASVQATKRCTDEQLAAAMSTCWWRAYRRRNAPNHRPTT
jgi:GT2 family glycosyltransferase